MVYNDFYTHEELRNLGLKAFGSGVSISKKCSLYHVSNIVVGNNVRIDDFCILSGDIFIGDYVHISAYSALYAGEKIMIGNFCGISPRCIIFSKSDDFSGNAMIGPMVSDVFTNVFKAPVHMHDYCQLGANTIVMPGVTCAEGSVTGAFSFVTKDLEPWSINCGIPAKKIKIRKKIQNNMI